MMRYKLLGKSGLRVSELCLGTMTFGTDWGWGAPIDDCRRMVEQYLEAGGNFIDTSVNYTNGSSETILGELLEPLRDKIVLATKYTLSRDWDDPNAGGNSRKNMMRSVETSLKRLRTDYIDLYYLHMWDYLTPLEEVMRGLDDLVRSGKVNYIAFSDTPAYIVSRAGLLAELRGWAPVVALQIPYSLSSRAAERELLPMARDLGLTVCPWGLLGGGVLTGKYTGGEDEEPKRMKDPKISERTQRVAAAVKEVAAESSRSPAQVAINWVRQQTPKADMLPILGARTPDQLADNLAALEWTLDEGQLTRLEEAGAIEMGFPHDFLPGNIYIFGNTYDKIDKRRP